MVEKGKRNFENEAHSHTFLPRLIYEDGNDDDTADTGKSIFSYTHTYIHTNMKMGKIDFLHLPTF